MKSLMALGGLLGFVIGVFFGYTQNCGWPSILWRGAVAAYVAGLLMRWWGGVWIKGLEAAHQDKLVAIARAKSEAKATSHSAKP